jgi:hypothetical protein
MTITMTSRPDSNSTVRRSTYTLDRNNRLSNNLPQEEHILGRSSNPSPPRSKIDHLRLTPMRFRGGTWTEEISSKIASVVIAALLPFLQNHGCGVIQRHLTLVWAVSMNQTHGDEMVERRDPPRHGRVKGQGAVNTFRPVLGKRSIEARDVRISVCDAAARVALRQRDELCPTGGC